MGVSSSQLQPQELISFKKLPTDVSLANIEIPERTENRTPTDKKWLIVFAVVIVLLLPFLIYTLCYADLDRLLVGYDKCGNFCGQKNYHWDNIPCSGKDMILSPYLEYEDSTRRSIYGDLVRERDCVQSCRDGYSPIFGKCHKNIVNTYSDESEVDARIETNEFDFGLYMDSAKWQIVISCLLSILVAMGMVFLFRYAVAFVVWGILIGCFIGFWILVVLLWYLRSIVPDDQPDEAKRNLTIYVCFITFIAIILGVVLIWFRKKIQLVIILLKEASKAIFDMSGLITVSMICVISVLLLTFVFLLITLAMASAGTLEDLGSDFYDYVSNPVMTFTIFYNCVVVLWISQFFTGIQYMVISGAVSKWYFTRDKGLLGSPIMTSVSNTFRFHLGTVALGSLIITLVQVIKMIILSLIKNEKVRLIVRGVINIVESFFKFLSNNAYIVTAMHGQSFIKSGKRAAKLIIQNISDIIAVNFIGDFILGMAKLLIIVITLLLAAGIFAISPTMGNYNYYGYLIIGFFSCIVACVTFSVFETTIDTLFICYCEDSLLNDGMARPYFMTRNLMEFVQKSKEIYKKK